MRDNGIGPPGGFQVLIVEDDDLVLRFLRATLNANGYRVAEAASGAEALAIAQTRRPDAVLLDLGLPDQDGLAVLARLRTWLSSPILVVSGRLHESDKVQALDAGANDYVTKPFATGELLARLRAALRQTHRIGAEPDQGMFVAGDLRIDRDRYEVFVRGRPIKLTPLEYRLLHTLARHAGKVVTRRQLLREVWGETHLEEAHYLRVYMSSLRRKLELDPGAPRLLLTEQNVGYRLFSD